MHKKTDDKNAEQELWNVANAGKTELFVQGINFDTEKDSLNAHFSSYGTITKCKLIFGKGLGFIEYESHEQAKAAIAATNESSLDGR